MIQTPRDLDLEALLVALDHLKRIPSRRPGPVNLDLLVTEIQSPPSSSLERDVCRRRLARPKGPEDDLSAQRPQIGDHHAREMAAKMAFLLASHRLRVSEDWVVETVDIELAAHHAVIEPVSDS